VTADLQLNAVKRMLALKQAPEDLLVYSRLGMPDPEHLDDVEKSRFEATPVARLLSQIVMKIFRRELLRVAVSVGPQMGKSQVLSRNGPAWMMGKDPYMNGIIGTYNQPFADEFGDAVRDIVNSSHHRQVFPQSALRKGGAAKSLLITEQGGRWAFVGRGGSGTGKPADFFGVDDPLKDDIEAQSDATREEVWRWFNKVAFTRCHSKSAILVVHTRWHEDDLIGRLCDPSHPEREKRYKGISSRWTYINLPAVVDDPKLAKALGLTLEMPTDPSVISMFGAKPMSSIWPGRKDLPLLAEAKMLDAQGFTALYMGQPTPDDGDYFKAEWLVEYDADDLPKMEDMTIYGASDHAVKTKQSRDSNVLGLVGVDERDNIWVLPNLVWDKMATDRVVEELLSLFQTPGLAYWWMESEHISKSFGPFLLKRMEETKTYIPIDDVTVSQDLQARARAIQGRLAMKKVRFPRFAPWWPQARQQILKFPNATNDDFVSFLSLVGQGLHKQNRPEIADEAEEASGAPRAGSMRAILAETKRKADEGAQVEFAQGW
jgi:predicted phage terminase large subunit-like protein